ncbi:IclR family transcriptional regulator [Comamonas sp. NLF-1-9]|uniref:IclR family transcriptional regulator n=1 Tax=Comamonas sp. NLF-1-9 TaxID=2853163 RepID=UPI001C449D98|nr:helix-turn-helix domain-containing protein [Comamonas sp. NLF-1-9]QXL85584.1 helix-turn-helix domain-containing protein [Comamonas sp. NLF-1-9]
MARSSSNSTPDTAATEAPAEPAPVGIQSLELGLELFELLAAQEQALGVSDLARLAGMHRAKVYRYLVSLVRAGWVRQDADSSLYQVGPALRRLALAWLARQDWLELASNEARELAQTQGNTCLVAVQTEAGVCAVRVYQPGQGVSVGVAPGALFDLRTSATGRVFAAWAEPAPEALTPAQRAHIRSQGVAVVEGEHAPGINALGAPVFDAHGHLLLALTLVGHGAALQADAAGSAALALREACARVSGALGWQPPQR